MPCWLQWASGFSDVYLCNFASFCQPPLFPWHTLSFSFNTDTENCCWLHACESSARGGRPGRATRMLTKPAEQECFPTREHLLTAAILQLRFGKWETGFQSFCSIEKPIGHRVVFFSLAVQGLAELKNRNEKLSIKHVGMKDQKFFPNCFPKWCTWVFSDFQSNILTMSCIGTGHKSWGAESSDMNMIPTGILDWEVHPPRHQREGFFGFVSLPLPSLLRDNSHNLHDHKRSLVRTRWTMLAVTSP